MLKKPVMSKVLGDGNELCLGINIFYIIDKQSVVIDFLGNNDRCISCYREN